MIRCRDRLLLLTAAWLLLGSWLRPVAAQLLGPEFQVNSYTTSYQMQGAVAADSSGNFVAVWRSAYLAGIFGQRYDSAGSPAGSEFQVNTNSGGFQERPAVAKDGAGNFVVTWDSYGLDGAGVGVFAQRFDSAGSRQGSEFLVNTFTTGNQLFPAMAADGSGSFVVVWESELQDGSIRGVFGQRFSSAGSPVGSELQINTFTTSGQGSPAVAADSSGNFVVAWQSLDQDGASYGVFAQRYDSLGNRVGNEFQVNTYTTGQQSSPAIAADGAGNFVVIWQSNGPDSFSSGVFGQRYDSAGSPAGGEFHVNTQTVGGEWNPAVAADGAGNFIVAWQSYGQDGALWGAFGQRFNSLGNRVANEFQVNSYTTSDQLDLAVAGGGSGDFVVTWASLDQDGSGDGVFGRRVRNWILIDGFELGDACAWSAAVGGGCP